ncbi:MAG: hypothetical protein ABIP21_06240 [Acidimicrobiia bacterium]
MSELIDGDGLSPAVTLNRYGELAKIVEPLLGSAMPVIRGFTELDPNGAIFNSVAILADGRITDVYRKVYPGYRTAFRAGHVVVSAPLVRASRRCGAIPTEKSTHEPNRNLVLREGSPARNEPGVRMH